MAGRSLLDPVCRVEPSKYVGKKDLAECVDITSGGVLTFGGASVIDFVQEHGSRCYIVDLAQVTRNAKRLVRSFGAYPGRVHLFYATKANFLKDVVTSILREGYGVEVTNIHELFFSLNILVQNSSKGMHSRIICNGVSKHCVQHPHKESLIEAAFRLQSKEGYDVIVNLSSMEEAKFAAKIAQRMGGGLRVGIRINPGITPTTSEDLATGAGYSRFGISLDRLEEAVREIQDSKGSMKAIQLHCHIGSQISNIDAISGTINTSAGVDAAEVPLLCSKVAELERLGVRIEQVNIGGGIGVKYVKTKPRDVEDYGEFWPNYDVEEYASRVSTAFKECCAEKGVVIPELCVEPGRWLTADSTALLVTATDVFDVQDRYRKSLRGSDKWVITDGSAMTDAHDAVLLQQWFEILNASKVGKPLKDSYNIGGIACDSGDVFAWGRDRTGPRMLPRTDKGDILTVLDVGAYQQALASNYNMLPIAPAYNTEGKEIIDTKTQG